MLIGSSKFFSQFRATWASRLWPAIACAFNIRNYLHCRENNLTACSLWKPYCLNFQFPVLINASFFLNGNQKNKHLQTSLAGVLFLLLARDDFTEDRGGLKGILLLFWQCQLHCGQRLLIWLLMGHTDSIPAILGPFRLSVPGYLASLQTKFCQKQRLHLKVEMILASNKRKK